MRRAERSKKRKFRRTPLGTKPVTAKKKPGKHSCTLCGRQMHGMPHGKRAFELKKMGKTQKRPAAAFAGRLCNKCRAVVLEEAIKLKEGAKNLEEVDFNIKPFVEEALKRFLGV